MQSRSLAVDALIRAFPATPPEVLRKTFDAGIELAIGSVHQIADQAAADALSGPIGPAIHVTATRLGLLLDEGGHERLERRPIGWWRGTEL